MMNQKPYIQQYLEFRSEFMGYLYAITRDVDLAEEVYQNAAVVVLETSEQHEAFGSFRAWAKEVVRRQALNSLRKKATSKKQVRPVSPELLDAVSSAFLNEPGSQELVSRESAALNSCLDKLASEKRTMVNLRYQDNNSFEEIAIQVGSTPAAIQRSISRIRKKLHDCIQYKLRLADEC